MSGLLESIAEHYKELIKELDGAVSDKEFTGLLSKAGLKSGTKSDKETTYGIEVDGEEKDYTFTGDKEFDASTMDKFRETHGITKGARSIKEGAQFVEDDSLVATIRYLMSKGQTELAGLVSNGKMEAHVAINLANSPQGLAMSQVHDAKQRGILASKGYNFITDKGARGAMSQEEIGKYPDLGWTNVNDSQEVKTFLNNMPHADRVQLEAMRDRVTGPQFQDFLRKYMAGKVGGGALHEALPFKQYQTGNPHLQNLGFVGGAY